MGKEEGLLLLLLLGVRLLQLILVMQVSHGCEAVEEGRGSRAGEDGAHEGVGPEADLERADLDGSDSADIRRRALEAASAAERVVGVPRSP